MDFKMLTILIMGPKKGTPNLGNPPNDLQRAAGSEDMYTAIGALEIVTWIPASTPPEVSHKMLESYGERSLFPLRALTFDPQDFSGLQGVP